MMMASPVTMAAATRTAEIYNHSSGQYTITEDFAASGTSLWWVRCRRDGRWTLVTPHILHPEQETRWVLLAASSASPSSSSTGASCVGGGPTTPRGPTSVALSPPGDIKRRHALSKNRALRMQQLAGN